MEHRLKVSGEELTVTLVPDGAGFVVRCGERELKIDSVERMNGYVALVIGERRIVVRGKNTRDAVYVSGTTGAYSFAKVRASAKHSESGGTLTAPMAGQVLKVFVKPSDAVEKGQKLLILEAMKMEHEIAAPVSGVIAAVHFAEGARCQQDDVLVELEEKEEQTD